MYVIGTSKAFSIALSTSAVLSAIVHPFSLVVSAKDISGFAWLDLYMISRYASPPPIRLSVVSFVFCNFIPYLIAFSACAFVRFSSPPPFLYTVIVPTRFPVAAHITDKSALI